MLTWIFQLRECDTASRRQTEDVSTPRPVFRTLLLTLIFSGIPTQKSRRPAEFHMPLLAETVSSRWAIG